MSAEIRSFRDLVVWQKAMELCQGVYGISQRFPPDERFGLTSQVRRAAVSVPSNIAEGYGRKRKQDYLRFLHIALGSLCELETQVLLAIRLEFTDDDSAVPITGLIRDVDRLLSALIRSLSRTYKEPT